MTIEIKNTAVIRFSPEDLNTIRHMNELASDVYDRMPSHYFNDAEGDGVADLINELFECLYSFRKLDGQTLIEEDE